MTRILDVLLSSIALVMSAPVFAVAALGIRWSSEGPIVYRALRIGRHGNAFTMYKFRTMDPRRSGLKSLITAKDDPRVFPFGSILRRLKIDELPQLWNILKGDMSIVGPRPEDPEIVRAHYAPEHYETLRVRPGLSSPGSLYQCTHGEDLIDANDPEGDYLRRLMPTKLALDTVYVRNASFAYDVEIICRTIWIVIAAGLGRRNFPEPREWGEAALLARPAKAAGQVSLQAAVHGE